MKISILAWDSSTFKLTSDENADPLGAAQAAEDNFGPIDFDAAAGIEFLS